MRSVQTAAKYLSLANLLVGIAGFFAPVVTGNSDRIINIHPGRLFGIFAVNWPHALLHVVFGLSGLPAQRGIVRRDLSAADSGPLRGAVADGCLQSPHAIGYLLHNGHGGQPGR